MECVHVCVVPGSLTVAVIHIQHQSRSVSPCQQRLKSKVAPTRQILSGAGHQKCRGANTACKYMQAQVGTQHPRGLSAKTAVESIDSVKDKEVKTPAMSPWFPYED